MAFVSVTQIKPGDKISQDVMTHKSSLLMSKGTIVSERELEVLRAFLIGKVHIESENVVAEQAEIGVQGDSESQDTQVPGTAPAFYNAYTVMFALLKRVFSLAYSSGTIPVLDIRTSLETLISHIGAYNIVSFRPAKYHPQDYLIHHSIKTSLTSYTLAKWIGFTQKDLIPIALGGLLHDIGNAKIDSTYLMKSSVLTSSEYEAVKRHTTHGYQILKNVPAFNEGSKFAALQHHERLDGSGYPLGLRGANIHPYSRIVAIADIYHAMTSPRLHNVGMSPYLVMEELSNESFGKLDPSYVQTFIHKITQFHTGMIVKLSDNRIGAIVFSQREHPTRPWVNVNGMIVNLTMERSLYIQEVIQ
jgi:HD-GYP domain-containing protein (c-di-GMP phosphodiesterase class II)